MESAAPLSPPDTLHPEQVAASSLTLQAVWCRGAAQDQSQQRRMRVKPYPQPQSISWVHVHTCLTASPSSSQSGTQTASDSKSPFLLPRATEQPNILKLGLLGKGSSRGDAVPSSTRGVARLPCQLRSNEISPSCFHVNNSGS